MSKLTDQEKQDRQTREEERIIANIKVCTVKNPGRLSDLNAEVLQKKLENDFYSASLLEALACYFDVTIHDGRKGIVAAPRDIHENLLNPHRIGAESVEGVALLTGIDDVDDLVIIKAPQRPEADGLVHEYFVSSTCLNPLRRRCPGFMYAFAAFRCSAPVLDGKKVVEWCTPKKPAVNYVVFEKINGPALEDMMKEISLDEFLSYFLQLVHTEMIGVDSCSWTHYDAHAGNVLCRKIKDANTSADPESWFWVPYSMKGDRIVYIKSNAIPTFIDYGRAHVKYKGKHYGFFDDGLLTEDGLYPDRARPLYDMYKLLGFALHSCLNEKGGFVSKSAQVLFRDLQPLYSFFRDVKSYPNYLATVKKERDSYYVYSVEIADTEKSTSLQDLLTHIETVYPDQWSNYVASSIGPEELVVTCSGIVAEATEVSKPCDTPSGAVHGLRFSVVKSKHTKVEQKKPEEVIQEVVHTRRRLEDIKHTRSGKKLTESVEYIDLTHANTRSEKLLRENYPKLRAELIERLNEIVRELRKEGELYMGLVYGFKISASPTENLSHLRNLLNKMEESHLSLILQLVKLYTINLATLVELEDLANEREKTDRTQFLLPRKLATRITKDASKVSEYLDEITPLTREGMVLRNGINDTIDLGQ